MSALLFAVLILVNPTEPPACYRTATGEIAGQNVELGREVAAALGEQPKFEAISFDKMLPRLKAGTADIAISDITITDARKRDVDFSIPYKHGGCAFFYRTGERPPRMSLLAIERIGAEIDTVGDLYLSRHGCDPIRYVTIDQALVGLENGEVDAVFFDRGPLLEIAKKYRGRYTVSSLETCENNGIAVSKLRPDVLKAANDAIVKRRGAK